MSKDKQELHKFFKNDDLIKDHSKPFDKDASKKYESFSTNITKLISEQGKAKPIIISLEATYGMGKTTLIDMWGTDLIANKDSIAIKYNAWEEDHSNEPFYSFVSSLIYQLSFFYEDKNDHNKKEILKAFTVEAQNLWTTISGSAVSLVKIASNISTHLKAVSSILDAIKKIFSALADMNKKKDEPSHALKSLVKKEGDMREAIKSFKLNLENLAEGKHIYIFIDEIDRCKPTFAIELLERIKHLFNVANVFFIVATTAHALQQNVQKFYGYEPELAKEYLERFFDFQFKIPTMGFADYMGYLVETKGDDKLKMEAWHFQSLSSYWEIINYIDFKSMVFTMPKEFLMEMVKNCERVLMHEKVRKYPMKFQELSFRLLNKAFDDVLVFNSFYKTEIPPEMYGFVLALILSYRLSSDKKEYIGNYENLIINNGNSIDVIKFHDSDFRISNINIKLHKLFKNEERVLDSIHKKLNEYSELRSFNLDQQREKTVLTFLQIRLSNKNTKEIYEKLKDNVEAQIEQIASIQSDDV